MTTEREADPSLQAALNDALNSTELLGAAREADVSVEVLHEWAEQILREAVGNRAEPGPTLVEHVVMPALRNRLNEQFDSGTLELRPEAPGLVELDVQRAFRTKAEQQLAKWMAASGGGTIGIIGPPDIGKTSLMLAACHGGLNGPDREMRVGVSTTIHDDTTPRDLLLDLLERVCRAVLGDTYGRDNPSSPPPAVLAAESPTTWLLVLLVGAALIILAALDVTLDTLTAAGIALVAIGAAGGAITVRIRHERNRGHLGSLGERAAAALDMVVSEQRFETTITSGWSLAAKPPFGFEGGRTGGVSRKQLPLEFRDLVQPFRELVNELALTSRIVIGLDGLDRRRLGEEVRRFLQDIRPLMGVPRCFFLITLPEPVGGGSGRRALYHLDEVIRMDLLDLSTAVEMIQSRVAGVPKPFAALCYCLSGGIPSDLIRTVRDMVDLHSREGSTALPGVASRLIGDELSYLGAELRMAALAGDSVQQAELDDWIDRLTRVEATAESLLKACTGFRISPSVTKSGPESRDVDRTMRRAAGLCYVNATLLEIFGQRPAGRDLADILEAGPPEPTLETLAAARNLLDRGAYARAWRFISEFRQGCGLKLVSTPFAN